MRLFLLLAVGGALVSALIIGSVSAREHQNDPQPSIILGQSVWVSADRPADPDVETFLAIDPKNADKMVAATISYDGGNTKVVAYFTQDGGATWHRSGTQPGGGDPVVYYDVTGAALFGSIGNLFPVWRSSDGGVHWNSKTLVPGGGPYDREYLGIDRTNGPYAGRIYAAGTVTVEKRAGGYYPMLGIAYSDDNGRSFDRATTVDATFDNGEAGGFGGAADLLVTSNGRLVVPFIATAGLKPSLPRAFWVFVSTNGGRSFTAKEGLPFDWGPRRTIRSLTADSNLRAAIDSSEGPYKDRIYVTYMNFADDRYNVEITHSDDLGASWSSPVRVNDNVNRDDISNIAITVNRNGVLAVVWNDRRDDPTDMCFRLYGSASLDGGQTFLPNVEIGSHPACPDTAANWSGSINSFASDGTVTLSSVGDRFMNGGESQGLAASPDGRFHVTWSSDVNDVMQLWYSSFTVNGVARAVGEEPTPLTQSSSATPNNPDITAHVRIDADNPVIDFKAKSIEFTAQVRNMSNSFVAAPLTLELSDIQSDFENLTIANAANGQSGVGAEWRIPVNGQGLSPGEISPPLVIRWHFNGRVPPPKHLLYQFDAQFKVLTKATN